MVSMAANRAVGNGLKTLADPLMDPSAPPPSHGTKGGTLGALDGEPPMLPFESKE